MKIGVIGANVPLKVLEASLSKFGFEAVYLNHCLVKSYPDERLKGIADDLQKYASEFLKKNSCPRTNDFDYKVQLKKRIENEGIKGLVVNAIKFCDFHHFDYRYFKENLVIPTLIIEHELDANSEGQIMTRLDAFFESILSVITGSAKQSRGAGGIASPAKDRWRARNDKNGYFVGIDSGSHATKLVCIDANKNVVARKMAPTGTSVKKSVEKALCDLAGDGIERDKIRRIVATGYGRNNVDGADEIITEISCHAAGAFHLLGKAATVIDIGGQDSKAIRIGDGGNVAQFAMNDKCAAGTGRFLEVMAGKLEMDLPEFAELALKAGRTVPVSSMCSVFAESEVISLIATGSSKDEIAKGIHRAIAERTASLTRRINGTPPYYIAGGVAKNRCLVAELQNCLGAEIFVIDEPQFTGALGAALFALKG